MVSDTPPNLDPEPTAEFDERCTAIFSSWENGDLPFKETIARLAIYCQEAIAAGQLANQGRAEQLLGNVQHYHGNLTTSIHHWERARQLFARINNQWRMATMDMNIGESYRFQGDCERAIQLYRTAYKIADEAGILRTKTLATVNEGLALLAIQQDSAARVAFEHALQLSSEGWPEADYDKWLSLHCEIYHGMATIYLREDNPEAAWECAVQALELTAANALPRPRGYAQRTAGEVITHLGISPDPRWSSDADEYFHAAIDSFREINAEAELARTMYAHAVSLAQRGRQVAAARKLQQATIIFTRLGMLDDAAHATEAQGNLAQLGLAL